MGHGQAHKITFGDMRNMGLRGVLIYYTIIAAATRHRSAPINGAIC
jgi:hypothetical protein